MLSDELLWKAEVRKNVTEKAEPWGTHPFSFEL